jgi:hypothetical protein
VNDNAERWREMSPDERERMRERMRAFRALSPEERARVLERAMPDVPPPADP